MKVYRLPCGLTCYSQVSHYIERGALLRGSNWSLSVKQADSRESVYFSVSLGSKAQVNAETKKWSCLVNTLFATEHELSMFTAMEERRMDTARTPAAQE